jgi:hypothetical protein
MYRRGRLRTMTSPPPATCEACAEKECVKSNGALCGVPHSDIGHFGNAGFERHHDLIARLRAERDAFKALVEKLCRESLHVKCGWENLNTPGHCGFEFCEHGSCEEALEIKRALAPPQSGPKDDSRSADERREKEKRIARTMGGCV